MYQEPVLEYEAQPSEPQILKSNAGHSGNAESVTDCEMKTETSLNHSEKWEGFVKFVEESADKSLVSLMRNSVLLQITQTSLTIGLQNTRLFTEEKRKQIEKCAQAFFQKEFTILYKDSVDGLDDSVREKIEQERIKVEEETKREAAESSNVKYILSMFQNSKIKHIEIIKEKEDV